MQARLTEGELEIMLILWEQGEGTVRDVLGALAPDREPAYTTISTLVRILERKGLVTSRKEGRSHVYRPTLTRAAYQRARLRETVVRLFGGSPAALVRGLLEDEAVQPSDLEEIRRLLDAHGEEP